MANSRSPNVPNGPTDSVLRRKAREAAALPGSENSEINADNSTWNADDALRREMERLEANRQFIVGNGAGVGPVDPFAVASPALSELDPLAAADGLRRPGSRSSGLFAHPPFSGQAFPTAGRSSEQLDQLKLENEELHKLVEEMKHIFAQASEQEAENVKTIEKLNARIAELDAAVAAKDQRVELLTGQIHELEAHVQQHVAAPTPPNEEELSKMSDELEKERCQLSQDRKTLEGERQQIRDDEEDMMRQMREMEVGMARERAEMARQRTDLQRLHSEVKRELEMMQGSDRVLTDRLVQFQRRHQDLQHRAGIAAPQSAAAPAPAPAEPDSAAGKKDSSLLGRFFGRK